MCAARKDLQDKEKQMNKGSKVHIVWSHLFKAHRIYHFYEYSLSAYKLINNIRY